MLAYILVAWCMGAIAGSGVFTSILVLSEYVAGIERILVVVVGVMWALSAFGTQVVTGLHPWIAFVVFTVGAATGIYIIAMIPGIGHGYEGLG